MAPGRVLIIAAFLFCNSVFADVANIEPGLPAEIADAEPIKQGEKQVQLLTVWDRQRNGDNRFVAEPQLQWGFAPRWQAALSVLGIAGSAEHTGSGDVRLQVMRKLNDENSLLPAFAAFLRFELPTGRDASGIDTTVRLAATKTLGAEPEKHQLHANLIWVRNAAPLPEERHDRLRLIGGYSRLLAEHTALVADVLREQSRERGEMASIAEIGLRRELSRETTVSFGAGAARGSPSAPRVRLTAGLERSF